MDGSAFHVIGRTRLCDRCRRVTWQPSICVLCQKGAITRD